MISVEANTIAEAWRVSCVLLFQGGSSVGDYDTLRDSALTIEVQDVTRDVYDPRFPMSLAQLDAISKYLVTGRGEQNVGHEWTKIYRRRLFQENGDQVAEVIDYLRRNPHGKRAQISIWDQSEDLFGDIAPCLQLVWFRVIKDRLELHVHMRASDCYGKLLMNMHEFASLQRVVSDTLGQPVGRLTFFVDSCHFMRRNRKQIEALIRDLQRTRALQSIRPGPTAESGRAG